MKIKAAIANDEVVVNENDGKVSVRAKQYLKDENGKVREKKPLSILIGPFNQEGTKETDELLGDGVFSFPKPVALIRQLLSLTVNDCRDNGGVFLDFFAGSGATAQAVMGLNQADGGNRQFILVQLPEFDCRRITRLQSRASEDQRHNDRADQRVIARFKKRRKGCTTDPRREFAKAGLQSLSARQVGLPAGRVVPDPDKTEVENVELLKRYIRDKEASFHIQWQRDTVLDEVLLRNGFMLDYTLTPCAEFAENEVYLAKDAHKESLICLDPSIADETVDHFKTHKDHFFICLQLALNTTKKWNLKHHLGDN